MFIVVNTFQTMHYSSYLLISAACLCITWKYYKQEKTRKSLSFFIFSLAFAVGVIYYVLSQYYVISNHSMERSIFHLIRQGLRMLL